MASGLWGFENVPELYVPRSQANPIGESIGGGLGQIFSAVLQGKQADAQRALALKRMQQEQGQFDARMNMDKQRMDEEGRRAAATLAMNEKHNAAQEANWGAEEARKRAADEALQSEKAGVRRAEPISTSLGQYKDVLDQPEVMPEAAKWNAAADVYKGGGAMMKQTGYSVPGLQMPEQSPVFDKGFKGPTPHLQMQPNIQSTFEPMSSGEYATQRAPYMARAADAATDRMALDKQKAAAAGRTSQSDALERIILKGQVDAIIAKAKGGKQPDAMEMMLIDKLGMRDAYNQAVSTRSVDLGNAVPEIRKLRPIPGQNMSVKPSKQERIKQLDDGTRSPQQISAQLKSEGY